MALSKLPWKAILAFLLAAFFLVGAIGNLFPPEQVVADYARWGYPAWFHYVTGLLELTVAILLAIRTWRFRGAAMGAIVMAAASVTVLLHGEYTHAIAPLTVLAFCIIVGWLHKPAS